MPIVDTAGLRQGELRADTAQLYNGLDAAITLEVYEELATLFNAEPEVYGFERALQGPILEIMLRGFLVDGTERQAAIAKLKAKLERLNNVLQAYAYAVWGKPLNPRSHPQLKDFFYAHMGLPEVWISEKGQRKLSFKREALEKLEHYFHARPIIAAILAIRDNSKLLEILQTEVDRDGRMRTSYNIAGTETGRLSSSTNAYGTGGNLQNIPPELRRVFVADPGYKLCVIDLEQAESREVGWLCGLLFGDWSYLDACEGGDLHTFTASLIWPRLVRDRQSADRVFYRHFSYRDMSKRGGHACNYLATPWTMARHLKVPLSLMEEFQLRYFEAFPAIPRWHRWVAEQLQTLARLETPFGFRRDFFGRPGDDTTLREAIAFSPQSSTAHRTNLGLYRHWDHFKSATHLLAQTHDSITFQAPDAQLDAIVPVAQKLMEVELYHRGRRFSVPGEPKVGWNWGPASPTNPQGLVKWRGPKSDTRKRLSGLERPLP